MMRNLLLMVTIALVVVIWNPDNGQTAIVENLESTEAAIEIIDYQDWYQKASQLEKRIPNVSGHSGSHRRRSGRDGTYRANSRRYSGLRPSGLYDRLSHKTKAERIISSQVIIFNAKDKTVINYSAKWKRQVRLGGTKHKCECSEDCKCPPHVCKLEYCKKNYAVVFGADWCSVCPRMWPVVNELRKRGYIVFYITTGDYPGILHKFGIKVWPTTLVMEKGKVKARFNGLVRVNVIIRYMKTRKQQGIKPKEKAKR